MSCRVKNDLQLDVIGECSLPIMVNSSTQRVRHIDDSVAEIILNGLAILIAVQMHQHTLLAATVPHVTIQLQRRSLSVFRLSIVVW